MTHDEYEDEDAGNIYDYSKLNYIREQIENMSKFNQVEVLRILSNAEEEVTINENKYGIHINLSELNTNILDQLMKYIKYISNQEFYLNNLEQEKEKYKNTFFVKDNKEMST